MNSGELATAPVDSRSIARGPSPPVATNEEDVAPSVTAGSSSALSSAVAAFSLGIAYSQLPPGPVAAICSWNKFALKLKIFFDFFLISKSASNDARNGSSAWCPCHPAGAQLRTPPAVLAGLPHPRPRPPPLLPHAAARPPRCRPHDLFGRDGLLTRLSKQKCWTDTTSAVLPSSIARSARTPPPLDWPLPPLNQSTCPASDSPVHAPGGAERLAIFRRPTPLRTILSPTPRPPRASTRLLRLRSNRAVSGSTPRKTPRQATHLVAHCCSTTAPLIAYPPFR